MSSAENAVHPGGFLKTMVLDTNGLTITDAAQALGVTRPAMSALINCRAALSSNMTLRIEHIFGIPLKKLMRVQPIANRPCQKRQSKIALPPYRRNGLHQNMSTG